MWTVFGTKSELLEGSGVGGLFWVRREGGFSSSSILGRKEEEEREGEQKQT